MVLMFVLMARKLRIQMSKLAKPNKATTTANNPNTSNSFELVPMPENFKRRQLLRRHTPLPIKNRSNTLVPAQANSCYESLTSIPSAQNSPINRRSLFYRVSMTITKATNNRQRTNHSEIQSEAKALQVLVLVFLTFVIAWLPYCLVNISSVIFSSRKNAIKFQLALKWLTYLGYLSSTLNPIIYTAFNKKFRKNFFQIIACSRRKTRKNVAVDYIENTSLRNRY
jgi:hypothetical protein